MGKPARRVRTSPYQQRIENPIATRILAGEFNDGDIIMVGTNGEQFTFDSRPAPEPEPEVVEAELVEE